MDRSKKGNAFPGILAIIFLFIYYLQTNNSDLLPKNMILPILLVFFSTFLGYMIYLTYRKVPQKDTDAQMRIAAQQLTQFVHQPISSHAIRFLGTCAISFIAHHEDAGPPYFIFFGILILVTLFLLIYAVICHIQGIKPESISEHTVASTVRIISLIFSTFGLALCSFICYLIIRHKIWFTIPLCVGFGIIFAKPWVSELQALQKKNTDTGETHLNTKTDTDPWDRPDIQR